MSTLIVYILPCAQIPVSKSSEVGNESYKTETIHLELFYVKKTKQTNKMAQSSLPLLYICNFQLHLVLNSFIDDQGIRANIKCEQNSLCTVVIP